MADSPPPTVRHPQTTPPGPFAVVTPEVVHAVRGSVISILVLIVVLSVWTVIGYVQWVNDPDPNGVLLRRTARQVAQQVEPVVPVPSRRPQRLIIVVIDGLRADFAHGMRSLNAVAAIGADLTLDVGLPTMSRAVYGVIASGSAQDRNGMRTNSYPGSATVDSIFERAREAGLHVAGVSNLGWWQELFPAGFDRYVIATFNGFWETARLALEGDYDVVLVHPTQVDYAGHQRGGLSSEYASAVRSVDGHLAALLNEAIDLERDTLWIVSDHGHRNKGGHGGEEPHVRLVRAVAAGPGVRGDASGRLSAIQLAATWALLMGLPFPFDAEGEPARVALDGSMLGEGYLEARAAAWQRHTSAYLERLAAQEGLEIDPSEGFGSWRTAMESVRQEGRSIRVAVALTAVLMGLALILHLRRDTVLRVLVAGATFTVVYLVAAWLTQNAQSLSAAEREYRYLLRLLSIGVLAFLTQHVVMHLLKITDWDTSYLVGVWFSGSTIGLVLAYYGIPLTAPLPGPLLLFWPLFATLMTATQAALGGFSLTLLWLLERRRGRRRPLVIDG